MARSTDSVRAERINAALRLMQKHPNLSEAAARLVRMYGLSKRQAYRYLEAAQKYREPVPIPDQKVAFTVKLSKGLIEELRQHARQTGLTLSELVGQALEAFLRKGRGRG
jgi:predicted DNA-binding transcriptional regulator YafY